MLKFLYNNFKSEGVFEMNLLKPKDLSKELDIPAYKISTMAKDIENAQLHTFTKTSLGSFQFEEKDKIVLEEYYQLINFFKKKRYALEMLEQQLILKLPQEESEPEWMKFLLNAKFFTKKRS